MVVLSRSSLVTRLGGRHQLAVALACGQWSRVLRSVYTDEAPESLRVRAEAAGLVLPAHALVAGRSALWLCGVPYVQDEADPLEVLVPRGSVTVRRPGLLVREGLVEPEDVGRVAGVACVRPARAAVDVARRERLPRAIAVLDGALRLPSVSAAGLERQVARAAGLRGVVVARRALELADPRAESPQESWLRVLLVEAGLVVPQHVVLDGLGRFVARLDLALVEQRVAVEYDGRAAHGELAFVRDRQRQNDLVALGWTVLRFTAADLARPAEVVARVRAVVAARTAA